MDLRWKDTSLSFEERTDILVSQMTLEEKVSQMSYFSSALSRFGIPEYCWWNECLHGLARAGTATVFPQSIGMAASFNPELLGEIADAIADETRVKHNAAEHEGDRGIYKGLTMWSPNINIYRDPRWGRGHETYGEDPLLTTRMGLSFIKALQGDDPKYDKCVATAKHFAVHSGPEADRHHFDAVASPRDKAQTYLPAFKAAVEEGHVRSVMGAYNRVDGEAACASKALLLDTLRGKWGFDGAIVSDCGAIEDIYKEHKLVSTPEEAAALAVNNGCDLCCGWVFPHLLEAAKQGLVSEETITRSVCRLMITRMRLGLLGDETPWDDLPQELCDCEKHHQLSLEMARQTLVLLKNDGTLPLAQGKLKTVAVVGPNADDRASLTGNYRGTPSLTYTVLEGLRNRLPGVRLIYAEGCSLVGGSNQEPWGETGDYRIAEAVNAARQADAVILVTGLNGDREGEEGSGDGDRVDLLLPESQRDLIDALLAVGKPIVQVNMTGSPTLFHQPEKLNAIMQAWYPGQMGGIAVAEALLGDFSPSGRLPVTFYRSMAQVPKFEDYSMQGRTYRYLTQEPAFPFGYGLSYAKIAYDQPKYEDGRVRVTVRNQSGFAAREITLCYLRLDEPRYPAPVKQLTAFASTLLGAGESRELALPLSELTMTEYDDNGNPERYHGKATLMVGGQEMGILL